MRSVQTNMPRPATPAIEAGAIDTADPSSDNTGDSIVSIEALRMCPLPPVHGNAPAIYERADEETRRWLLDGHKPVWAAQIKRLAMFCVKNALPDALSWLVLQCELDRLDLSAEVFMRRLSPGREFGTAYDAAPLSAVVNLCRRFLAPALPAGPHTKILDPVATLQSGSALQSAS